ncbi:NUDIX domain-containing protein [Ammoniphilus sp. CFH 90114]|uniref:NUDIX domain-containing protein n=1 Tax=Ammoniphilus sp. CFH 90114 TaxID=2493665 RepID=UPI00100FBD67|nr:NUDIX hydrolase [Ammoniphilus sp. CFH 90114]RXT13824.1 NUDIX hydrolase [Ammoniphilus sp. CFH 90114]
MSKFNEKTVKSDVIFEGKVITLQVDEVELPNGKLAKREIVRHPGAVAVIAITPENRMIMVRQFRKPLEKTILEIPAGKLEKGEEPLVCAERELIEETGYRAEEMKFVSSFYTSPGFANEIIHIYEASGLESGDAQPDQDEFVDLVEVTLEQAFEYIQSGDIIDAKTIFAIYYWENTLLKR